MAVSGLLSFKARISLFASGDRYSLRKAIRYIPKPLAAIPPTPKKLFSYANESNSKVYYFVARSARPILEMLPKKHVRNSGWDACDVFSGGSQLVEKPRSVYLLPKAHPLSLNFLRHGTGFNFNENRKSASCGHRCW